MRGFKPIPGFEGYAVSRSGRVIRLSGTLSGKVKELKQYANCRTGYMTVKIRVDGRYVSKHVHSLVAAAYIGPRPEGFVTDHISGVRTNNRLSNLRYIPTMENFRTKSARRNHRKARLNNSEKKPVQMIDLDGNVLAQYESIRAASKATGIIACSISAVCHGHAASYRGTHWRFA